MYDTIVSVLKYEVSEHMNDLGDYGIHVCLVKYINVVSRGGGVVLTVVAVLHSPEDINVDIIGEEKNYSCREIDCEEENLI